VLSLIDLNATVTPGWNCMTHRQALQDFPGMIQISLHKYNKIKLPIFLQFLLGAGK
jgi:hypothetical protein